MRNTIVSLTGSSRVKSDVYLLVNGNSAMNIIFKYTCCHIQKSKIKKLKQVWLD